MTSMASMVLEQMHERPDLPATSIRVHASCANKQICSLLRTDRLRKIHLYSLVLSFSCSQLQKESFSQRDMTRGKEDAGGKSRACHSPFSMSRLANPSGRRDLAPSLLDVPKGNCLFAQPNQYYWGIPFSLFILGGKTPTAV